MTEVRISVRGLVEFILRHGNIDNRHQAVPEDATQEGSRIHRMIQKRMGPEYQAEVPLKYMLPKDQYNFIVEGRADGIFQHNGLATIDEIKGTYRELARMREPRLLHLAQAKCYAYLYSLSRGLEKVRVRMTYCNILTEELRYFYEEYSFGELESWFTALVKEYLKWADYSWEWHRTRQESIKGLAFPFPWREGQRELVTDVYRTIYHKKKLFLEAPTGVGKTLSTVFPAVQAMGKDMGDRLFYLTAKTITRTVAEEALNLLREKGLRFKSVILTAKEKICFMDKAECNPETCPYARGHYDRINDAVFELLTREESFTREKIEEYARKHWVCPFEMCLDMSLFADGIICDYNYLFDPHVYLKRFFGEGSDGEYIFLIDEAHNLLERGREMYSAELFGGQFLELCGELKRTLMSERGKSRKKSGVSGQIELEMTDFLTGTSETGREEAPGVPEIDRISTEFPDAYVEGEESGDGESCSGRAGGKPEGGSFGGRSVLAREGYGDKMIRQLEKCRRELLNLGEEGGVYRLVESIEVFVQNLMRLQATMEDYLSEQEEEELTVREPLLELYFEINHFLLIDELVDENYVTYSLTNEEGDCLLKLFCVNPCENMKGCMARGRSSILFSATFLPIQYYKSLLGGDREDYEVYARSVFDPAKRALFVAKDVTSKYTRRSEGEYRKIARYIDEIVKGRQGNYMVFCPSYSFLRTVYEACLEYCGGEGRKYLVQEEAMSEAEREEFLESFRKDSGKGSAHTLIGFCVLGGIFSEGIDLKKDSLIGAVIVGTGLPQVGGEREILKWYFDGNGGSGFDYAYRYPGMNKVLQAAGRVIRTVEDRGVIALLDERFLQYAYSRLFPREWQNFEAVTVDTVAESIRLFWTESMEMTSGI